MSVDKYDFLFTTVIMGDSDSGKDEFVKKYSTNYISDITGK